MPIVFVAAIVLIVYVIVSLFSGKRIFLPLLGFVTTVFVGFFVDSLISVPMNWPGAGAIFSVATMGGFILWAVQKPKKGEDEEHKDN